MKRITMLVLLLTVMALTAVIVWGSNRTLTANMFTAVNGFNNMIYWSGQNLSAAGTPDTTIMSIGGMANEPDSMNAIAHVWSKSGQRSAVKLRFQQSMNGTTWITTTLGTDSTTYTTTGTTAATGTVNNFPIGYARYGVYPYSRLLLINGHTGGAADTTPFSIYLQRIRHAE